MRIKLSSITANNIFSVLFPFLGGASAQHPSHPRKRCGASISLNHALQPDGRQEDLLEKSEWGGVD